MISIKSEKEIEYMRDAGKIIVLIFDELHKIIRPGISTLELDRVAEKLIKSHSGIASFKGYAGLPGSIRFPGSICSSINSEVVHGIPDSNVKLVEGDIVSIDVGVLLNGYHADAARTYGVGKINSLATKLIKVTEECFFKGIKFAKSGLHISDISGAIQDHVESQGFSVVRDYVGHGIGRKLHEDPAVPNYRAPGKGPKLYAGMTLAIEPMVNQGDYEVDLLKNKWTVITADGSLSAHYENTIAITNKEPIVLTI